jgi:hypothetical protein
MSSNHGGTSRVVGVQFNFFRIFFRFFGATTVKMASFSIEMVKFKFKCTT